MIRLAQKAAKKSTFMRHRVGAVLVKGNRVLGTGFNAIRYNKTIGKPTIHAEEAAVVGVLKNMGHDALIGSRIYVSRFTNGGNIGLAAPCPRCRALLQSFGVAYAIYTLDGGGTETISL